MSFVLDAAYSFKNVFLRPLGVSLFFGLLALVISGLYFPKVFDMTACALFAVSLANVLAEALEFNRLAIWDRKDSPIRANKKLAEEFTAIFLGMFFASVILQILYPNLFLPEIASIQEAFRNEFSALYQHNLYVLIASVFIAFIYRAGGLAIILSWNAVNWASTLTAYIFEIYSTQGILRALTVGLALMPHLILEVLAYVLAGMSGTFFSKGLFKYSPTSSEFHRVSWASTVLLIVSLLILLLANTSEIYLAQPIFHDEIYK